MNEADTCRKLVVPELQVAGWDNEPQSIAEQRSFTDGLRVVKLTDYTAEKVRRLCASPDELRCGSMPPIEFASDRFPLE